MAGGADSESGCDEGAASASNVHLAADGGTMGGGNEGSCRGCESWMKLDRPRPTRYAKCVDEGGERIAECGTSKTDSNGSDTGC
eukprot:3196220-Prymnesium_polylepis.1